MLEQGCHGIPCSPCQSANDCIPILETCHLESSPRTNPTPNQTTYDYLDPHQQCIIYSFLSNSGNSDFGSNLCQVSKLMGHK